MLTLSANGFDMSYTDGGSGSPIVLVHGSFSDLRFWSCQVNAFAKDFRVLVPSLRPYWPRTTLTTVGAFDVLTYVRDVCAFIERLDCGPVHLCGHSLGGHIALRVTRQRPDLIRTLVLAEPGGPLASDVIDMSRIPEASAIAEAMATAASLVQIGDIEAGLQLLTASATRAGGWQACPSFYREMARANAHTLIAQVAEKRPAIELSDIKAIEQPVLLIGGADTVQPFPAILDALQHFLPRSVRATIAGGTHLMNIENPLAFNEAALTFWRRHSGPAQDAV